MCMSTTYLYPHMLHCLMGYITFLLKSLPVVFRCSGRARVRGCKQNTTLADLQVKKVLHQVCMSQL